ncbi:hypothetical protein GCM10020220_095150 [Nonomuraea rubra]
MPPRLGAAIVDGLASHGANVVYGDLANAPTQAGVTAPTLAGVTAAMPAGVTAAMPAAVTAPMAGHNPQHSVSGGAGRWPTRVAVQIVATTTGSADGGRRWGGRRVVARDGCARVRMRVAVRVRDARCACA